ncbi:MAG: hypothetical protein ACR2FU_20090 [Streptosporangiaceae bacterium]
MTQVTQAPAKTRAQIAARTLRQDRWRRQPAITAAFLTIVVVYLTWASLVNANYFWKPYISPLYSPCLATTCAPGSGFSWIPWLSALTPAIIIIGGPMGFRLTCYYYRKAYYRAFWLSPPACAVAEPHRSYSGETRFPLIMQNIHRYFFYAAVIVSLINTFDAVKAFRGADGGFGIGLGTLIMVVNVAFLWLYTVSCHSCRHLIGGRLKHFSRHPTRYRAWTAVSRLNTRHMELAWTTLGTLMFTDAYIALVASGTLTDLRLIN